VLGASALAGAIAAAGAAGALSMRAASALGDGSGGGTTAGAASAAGAGGAPEASAGLPAFARESACSCAEGLLAFGRAGACDASRSAFADGFGWAAWVDFFFDCDDARAGASALSCVGASCTIGHGKRSLSHARALLHGRPVSAPAAAATIAKLRGVSMHPPVP